MDFVQPGEPGDQMASFQCGPVQCFQQAVDTGGVSISAKYKVGCLSLDCFSCMVMVCTMQL